jgi:hypothetical protein
MPKPLTIPSTTASGSNDRHNQWSDSRLSAVVEAAYILRAVGR